MKKLFCILCIMIYCPIAWAANFTAQVNRQTLYVGETFQLVLTLDDKTDKNPDLSALEKQFDIVGTTKGSQAMLVNGKASSKTQWIVDLMAKNPGELAIPAITLGDLHTQPVSLSIKPASDLPTIKPKTQAFLDVSVSPSKTMYVQGQLNYTLKLFYQLPTNIINPSMTPPHVEGAQIKQLPGEQRYQITKDGKDYGVLEVGYVIFPEKAGDLTIQPPVFTAYSVDPSASSSDFMNALGMNQNRLHITAKPITVKILPRPESQKNQWWLPAQALSLTQTWSKQPLTFRVGEPVTRTLELMAKGVTAVQLPAITSDKLDHMSVYADKPQLQNYLKNHAVVSQRTEKMALVPNQAGSMTLPEIRIPWWNVKTHRAEEAVIPAMTINVLPALHQASTPASDDTSSQSVAPKSAAVVASHNVWFFVAVAFILLWLLTILLCFVLCRRKKQAQSKNPKHNARTVKLKTLLQAVKQACYANDPQAAKEALLAWGRAQWPDEKPVSVGRVAELLQDEDFYPLASELDAALYQKQATIWAGSAFWRTFHAAVKKHAKVDQSGGDDLPGLYD